jgi:enoyl-CoA hydratase
MTFQNLIVETKDAVGIVTFNRPQALNALNAAVTAELKLALDQLEADAAIAVIVVTGSEKAFAAGADIKEMKEKTFAEVYSNEFITRDWER